MGSLQTCGHRCAEEYCAAHRARLRKGRGTLPCIGCGIGVKTQLALCQDCGGPRLRAQIWRKKYCIFLAEFQRLAAICEHFDFDIQTDAQLEGGVNG